MSKKKLTKQQQRRISSNQQQKLNQKNPEQRQGIIISRFSNTALVECELTNKLYPCDIRKNIGTPVCGDNIAWELITAEQGVITTILPRKSVLSRTLKSGIEKPLAANVDQVIITLAVLPTLSTYLLDSYLVACEALDLMPIILLNKCDLLSNQDEYDDIIKTYTEMDYHFLKVSAKKSETLNDLFSILSDKTSVFVGQSGVGKSTLINQIIPDAEIKTRAISEQTALGTHSTTTSRLYRLQHNSILIDSPGVREFGLSHMPAEKIFYCFKELRPLIGQCKYRNCTHSKELDCALLNAAKTGKIAEHRLEHYHKIMQQFGQNL